ncbi:MAG: hypothetical protein NVSMB42_04820 [Herpetosiphon sp.]
MVRRVGLEWQPEIAAEVDSFGQTRLNIGVNDWDFAWRLQPGVTFAAPSTIAGYSAKGVDGVSPSWLHASSARVSTHYPSD